MCGHSVEVIHMDVMIMITVNGIMEDNNDVILFVMYQMFAAFY